MIQLDRQRLKRNHLFWVGFVLLAWSLIGCATQATMVDMEMAQQKIQLEQNQIRERLQLLEGSSEAGTLVPQTNQTDLMIRLDQLATEIQALRGKLEESNYLSADFAQRLDDLTFRSKEVSDRLDIMDRQVALLEVSVARVSKSSASRSLEGAQEDRPSDINPQPNKAIVLPGRPMEGGKSKGLSPSEAYGLAYNDYIKGNYDLALMGFRNFLSQYKATSLAPNAQYWIGESYYGKKHYRKAINAFQQVVSDYPDSNKVPAALLKTGYSYMELADRERGKNHLKKVIEDYPFTNEARLAKNRLAELN